MSQDSERDPAHHIPVQADGLESSKTAPVVTPAAATPAPAARAPAAPALTRAIDPAARASKRMYQGLSGSSVGLELGIAVIVGVLFGMWLDRKAGTEPWLMLLFLGFGLFAGFRNVLRAVARAEKADHG
jgi:ATP synthase protein I